MDMNDRGACFRRVNGVFNNLIWGFRQNGERMLSVGFEYGGRLTQPTGQVEITLPAAMLDGYALMLLDADGTETALPHTLNGDEATFTLDFTTNGGPALALRLISVS